VKGSKQKKRFLLNTAKSFSSFRGLSLWLKGLVIMVFFYPYQNTDQKKSIKGRASSPRPAIRSLVRSSYMGWIQPIYELPTSYGFPTPIFQTRVSVISAYGERRPLPLARVATAKALRKKEKKSATLKIFFTEANKKKLSTVFFVLFLFLFYNVNTKSRGYYRNDLKFYRYRSWATGINDRHETRPTSLSTKIFFWGVGGSGSEA